MHRMLASGLRSPREWLPALILALLLVSSASADVVIREKSVSEGIGGFGNATTSRTLIVAGDKSRSEDESTYGGRFKTLAGGGKPRTSVSITRLDRELVWTLDPERKSYTETSFAQMREAMRTTVPGAADEEMTFTADVKRTGLKQLVNGFPAEQVIITVTGRPAHPASSEAGELRMVMDEWLAKAAPGGAEQLEFARRFAEKMGSPALQGVPAAAQRMVGPGMRQLAEKMKGLGGTPVRSILTVETTGQTAAAQARAGTKGREPSAEAGPRQPGEKTDGGVGGKLGGMLSRRVGGGAKKSSDEKAERKAEGASAPGPGNGGPVMKVVTDVVSISRTPAPAGSFDVPAGYRLQKKD